MQANHAGRGTHILAIQCGQQFVLAVARHAGYAHHFSGTHLERHALQFGTELVLARQAQAIHLEHLLAGRAGLLAQGRRLRADHHAAERGVALLLRIALSTHTPASQHGTGRAQGTDFMQLVADIQNAAALGGQTPQHLEQALHRLRREHGSGLVQNQQARIGQQGADDLDALALAYPQRMHGTLRIQRQAVDGSLLADHGLDLRQAVAAIQTEPDVLGHRERIEQAEVLEHHGDAQRTRLLRRFHTYRLAIDGNAAFVSLHSAVDDLHQRGFAGAVLTQHGMDLSRLYRERDSLVGCDTGVALGNVGKLQSGCGHGVRGQAVPPRSVCGAAEKSLLSGQIHLL